MLVILVRRDASGRGWMSLRTVTHLAPASDGRCSCVQGPRFSYINLLAYGRKGSRGGGGSRRSVYKQRAFIVVSGEEGKKWPQEPA